jgi:hypothetical protein
MISEQALPRGVTMGQQSVGHPYCHHTGGKHQCIKRAMEVALKKLAENAIDDIFFGGVPVCEIVEWMTDHNRNNHGSAEVRQEVKRFLVQHDYWRDDGTTEVASDACDCRIS